MRFQEKVWRLIRKIPKGRVTTYKMIAEKIGTKSYRAVGTTCNKNPYAPKIPCQRVVNSNRKVGGYAYGSKNKINLLKKEGVKIVGNRIVDFENVCVKKL